MIKNTIIILIIFLTAVSGAFAALQPNGFSDKFIKKFKNCEPYMEPANFNLFGTVFRDFKQIQGWNGKYCGYRQVSGNANGRLTVICNFSEENVNTLYNALLLKSGRNTERSQTEIIWDKHIFNPDICKIEHSHSHNKGYSVDEPYIPDLK